MTLPKQLQIALDRPTFDKDGQALVTPAVATADDFGSAVNALQAELDAMREQGRRLLAGRIDGLAPPALANSRAGTPVRQGTFLSGPIGTALGRKT